MNHESNELLIREIYEAYKMGTISAEHANTLMQSAGQSITFNLPTHEPIVGYFNFETGESMSQEEYERREGEFILRGAL